MKLMDELECREGSDLPVGDAMGRSVLEGEESFPALQDALGRQTQGSIPSAGSSHPNFCCESAAGDQQACCYPGAEPYAAEDAAVLVAFNSFLQASNQDSRLAHQCGF